MQRECHGNVVLFFRRAFLLVGLMGTLGGCLPKPAPPPDPRIYEGATLRVAAPDHASVRQLLTRHGVAWTERTGAKVEFVSLDSANSDLTVFAPVELPRFAAHLTPLPDQLRDRASGFDFSMLLRPYRSHLLEWDGKNYALPILGEGSVCVWRADLVDAPRHRAAIQQTLKSPMSASGPATWQEFEAIASYFASQSEWDGGRPAAAGRRTSLPAWPTDHADADREFFGVASSFCRRGITEEQASVLTPAQKKHLIYDFQFDSATGEPRLTSPCFVEPLQLLTRIEPFRAATGAIEAFRTEAAMIALVPLSDLAGLVQQAREKNFRLGVGRVPGSAVFYDEKGLRRDASAAAANSIAYIGTGGWMAAVTRTTSRPEMTLDLLTYLSGAQASLEIAYEPSWGGGPTRQSHLELSNRSGWYNYGLDQDRTNALVSALERGINPPITNPTFRFRSTDEASFREAIQAEIRAARKGEKKPEAALADAQRRWLALIEAKGRARHLQDYRLSLGLTGTAFSSPPRAPAGSQ